MKLFDRYTSTNVLEQDLPNQIDFGRYCTVDENGNTTDITYSNFPTNKAISQELLLEKHKSLQDIFIDISIDTVIVGKDNFNVLPLIRRIRNKLALNEFEKLLNEKLFHLEEIFRVPHYLLKREIEKVHVSRAKRIPSKSYQYLASHTEDWVHKSIVNFKPSRILNEELEVNFDIYENQLIVSFLERCLSYLNSRLKEIQDIRDFHQMYQGLLNKDFSKGWYRKLKRNFELMGSAYDDENYKAEHGINDQKTLSKTEDVLNQINKRLLLLRKTDLCNLVNKRGATSMTLRNTNVLVNHKHYRYAKTLWIELDKLKPEKSDFEKRKFEQDIITGLRAYAKSLVAYALKKNLEYEIRGDYSKFKAEHLFLTHFSCYENENGIIEIGIGENKLKLVTSGNLPKSDEKLISTLKHLNTYVLYFDENKTIDSDRLIHINPLDPDSVERVGALLRKYMLLVYYGNINRAYKFRQLLKEYIKYIPGHFIEFDKNSFSYRIHSYPKIKLQFEEIKGAIENDSLYKSKSRPEKEIIISGIQELLSEIENNSIKLRDEHLNCFNCGEKLQSFNIKTLDYIKCPTCYCLIDSSNKKDVVFKIDDQRFKDLSANEFGLDFVVFNVAEL